MLRRSTGEVMKLGLPSVARLVNKYSGKLIIAGGGPSLKKTLPDIRRQLRLSKKTKLLAINKTHDWLLKMALKPDLGVMIDPKPWVSRYQTPTKGVKYLFGAKCDLSVFEKFKNHPEVYLWHPMEDKEEPLELARKYREWICIPGYSTTGLRAINLGYELGFRKFELHGLDCSHDLTGDGNATRGNGHAYEKYTAEEHAKYKPESDLGLETTIIKSSHFGERYFRCSKHMARQIGQFKAMMDEWDKCVQLGKFKPIDVTVAGEGALPYFAALVYGTNPLPGEIRTCYGHVNRKYNHDPNSMPYTPADTGDYGMPNIITDSGDELKLSDEVKQLLAS